MNLITIEVLLLKLSASLIHSKAEGIVVESIEYDSNLLKSNLISICW